MTDETQIPTLAFEGPAKGPTDVPLPNEIGGFRILSVLGRGGMGIVYEAEQETPHRRVALKVIRAGGHSDELRLRLFRREAETLARLVHPGIAPSTRRAAPTTASTSSRWSWSPANRSTITYATTWVATLPHPRSCATGCVSSRRSAGPSATPTSGESFIETWQVDMYRSWGKTEKAAQLAAGLTAANP